MRSVPLFLGASLLLVGATFQSEVPALLNGHYDKLEAAKSLTAEYSLRKIGTPLVTVKLTIAKPNEFRMETSDTTIVSNGTTLTTFFKKDSSYTEEPVTEAAIKAFATKPELILWRGFFDKTVRKDIIAAKTGSKRALQGNDVTEVLVDIKAQPTATYFIDAKTGIARGGTLKDETGDTVILATKLELDKEPAKDAFTITLPANAKKKEPKPAGPTFADVQKILNDSCMPCHNAQNGRGGYVFTNYAGVSQAVVPGNSAGSMLFKVLRGQGAKQMPPNRPPVSDDKVKQIAAWIDAGAKE